MFHNFDEIVLKTQTVSSASLQLHYVHNFYACLMPIASKVFVFVVRLLINKLIVVTRSLVR